MQKTKIDLLERQNNSNLDIVNKENLSLVQENSILKEQITGLRQDVIRIQGINHDLTFKINSLTADLETNKSSLLTSIKRVSELEAESHVSHTNLSSTEQNLKQTISDLQNERNSLQEKAKVLQFQVSDTKASLELAQTRIQQQSQGYQDEIATLKETISKTRAEIRKLEDNLIEAKRNVDDLNS